MTAPDVTIEQLTLDFNRYSGDVMTVVADIKTQLATVQQELADALANGTIPAPLQRAINDLDTAVNAADVLVAPVVPVPEPEPPAV